MPDYAIYGVHFYGTARYGTPPRYAFDLGIFEALPDLYDRIKVNWGHPSGSWDKLRLVRGMTGFPMDQTEGTLLVEASNTDGSGNVLIAGLPPDPQTYEDTRVAPLRFHYYSIFVRTTPAGDWIRAGNTVCLLPKDYGYADRLYELTPGVYRDDDIYISSYLGLPMLQTYLSLIGYECNTLRSEMESLLWVMDPDLMSYGLLAYLADELGFPLEAELGGALIRRQLLNAVYIYKLKGTALGLEKAVEVLTGWSAEVTSASAGTVDVTLLAERVNLVVNSSAETDVSSWTTTNAALARSTAQRLYGSASFALTVTANGDVTAATPAGTAGMPVTAGSFYTGSLSVYKASGTAKSLRADIRWYNASGGLLSTSQGTPVTQVIGSWSQVSVTAVAPAGAAWAAVVLTVLSADAAAVQYYDAVLFEASPVVQPYFDGSTPMDGTSVADYLWESTVNLSRSHYYHRRAVRNSRLVTRITDFLPMGITYTLHYAQPL
jgi:phage tail-like protein